MEKTFYITTPIYYPSDKLHIGHCYTTVAADALSRFKRLEGYDVCFLTGTDEHGQKIQRIAEGKGVEPKEYVDSVVVWIKELWKRLDISNDIFIRTSDEQHKRIVQKIFKRLYEQGDIYKSKYKGWYCTPCEAFWTERQLKEGNCPDCSRPVELVEEESYFFRLSKYQDRLLKYIEENPESIQPPSRKNEMINNFLKPGLEDLCVSRTTFKWGIEVPFDTEHVIYVWIDALSNYITALGYLENGERYERYWPADVHLVGKEIVRFHTIIWPIMLMALDIPLPKQVFGHGWLLLEGGKMSKSKGNVVDPNVLIEKYGVDSIRYFLLREVPFGADGVFSEEALVRRINFDLANDLGNLLHRTLNMIEKYNHGIIPIPGVEDKIDEGLKEMALSLPIKMKDYMDKLEISSALTELWNFVKRTNKYIDETMPWKLVKDPKDKDRLNSVIYNLCESLRFATVLIGPYLPNTPNKIVDQLGISGDSIITWESLKSWGSLPSGLKVKIGEPIFPRIELEEPKEVKTEKPVAAIQDVENFITIEDFQKVELKVGEVVKAEKVEGADKLLKLQVDIGTELRTVVSGIAKQYSPESLLGKKVILVSNLKPAKLRGIESQGMILAASSGDLLSVATLDDENIPKGSKVK